MTDALTIGWNAARVDESRTLYRRVLGLNLILHLLIGLACLFFPHWVADVFDLPGPIPSGWTRGWGATLILVTALYVPGWYDPAAIRSPNIIGILGRFWMGTVWLFIGGGFLWFALFDYVFFIALALLYWRFRRATLMSFP
jgi:hypothetical protein